MYKMLTWFQMIRNRLSTQVTQPGVFIIGMHRSGTSCLTGMLEQLGLYLGNVVQTAPFNIKGNRESRTVEQLNNLLLEQHGGTWYRPKLVTDLDYTLQRAIRSYCRTLKRAGCLWGIKDPRMLFCLNAWRESTTILVGTFRYPTEVARSLYERNQRWTTPLPLALSDWEHLWFEYNQQLVKLYRQEPFPIINFDWDMTRYTTVVKNLAQWLGLQGCQTDFFDETLRHRQMAGTITNLMYQQLYDDLLQIAEVEERKLTRRVML